MANFFKTFFTGDSVEPENEKAKAEKKNFELFKYDGMRAERIGNIDYAIKCYTEALAIQDDFETLSYLAKAYINQSELGEARKTLHRMIDIDPNVASTYLTLANINYTTEHYQITIENCLDVLRINNEDTDAYLLLAKGNHALNDDINAIINLTEAIKIKNDFTEAYLMRAEVLEGINEHESAMEDIEKVIELNAEEEAAYLVRGKIKEHTSTEEATADYKHVIELNPFNEQAYLYLGQLLISAKKYDEAIENFDEAIELKEDFSKAYHERGRAKFLNDDKEGSMEDIKKAMELNPKAEKSLEGQFNNFTDIYAGAKLF
ncbi:tetratricopeptide repeat protein [uncultured Bacteroides sp.]|uniref:tetratricopeptide repeat protein n=1 Tax=uncultured Bacteroides sp. TaxID=162156 RepID=UPI002AAAC1F5|nr:tetratricopeptide repeat protein [uncultured Bacteroides sp.]